jgi:hypothetical protein
MESFFILAKKINFVSNNLDTFILNTIKKNIDFFEYLQKEQMSFGENSKGFDIGILKNKKYASNKKQKGGKAQLGIVDLKNEGDFYDKIYAKIQSSFLIIDSTDFKTPFLEKVYKNDIWGLNDKYLDIYLKFLTDKVIEKIVRYLTSDKRNFNI